MQRNPIYSSLSFDTPDIPYWLIHRLQPDGPKSCHSYPSRPEIVLKSRKNGPVKKIWYTLQHLMKEIWWIIGKKKRGLVKLPRCPSPAGLGSVSLWCHRASPQLGATFESRQRIAQFLNLNGPLKRATSSPRKRLGMSWVWNQPATTTFTKVNKFERQSVVYRGVIPGSREDPTPNEYTSTKVDTEKT